MAKGPADFPKDISPDLIGQLFEHRLQQEDIKRVLDVLSVNEREAFLDKIADIVGKLAALLEVANRISDTLSLDTLLERMIVIITEVTGSDRSTLFLNDAETGELFSRIAQGNLTREIRFPNHLGIAGEVFTSGLPVIIQDAYQDPRFNPEVDRKTGYRTRNILCAPIRTNDKTIVGVAQVLNKLDGDFTLEDLHMLEAICGQAASALMNAQLHEQVIRAKEEEAKILEINAALSSELNLGRLLDQIMQATKDLLAADRCTLFMHDPKTSELWSQVAQGIEINEIRFPCHMGIAGTVFTTGETINIPDAYGDDRFNPAVDKKTGYKTRSILCMPLKNKEGRIIGVTQVLNKKGGPFTNTDERRLASFSSQASVAIENAQLFEEVLNMRNYNESMLESMSNGVISLDAEGLIVKANTAALNMLKVPGGLLTGRPAAEYFIGPNEWVARSIAKVAQTGKPDLIMDTDLDIGDDACTSVNLSVVPLINAKDIAIGSLLVLEDITREKRLKGTMARYMTKELAERLLESGESMLGGQAIEASILFSDIRSFTTLSEKLGPQGTVAMLNDYFGIMVDIIFRYQGILDKYIGDAIMAVFGAPIAAGADADRAVQAGVDMMLALESFNRSRVSRGEDPIRIGIGIATDVILSGNIGSMKRMDYTVIGDGVNLASRLESVTKYYGTSILISESTFHKLEKTYLLREIDRIRVQGKTRPVGIYEVMDHHFQAEARGLGEMIDCFCQGVRAYQNRDWTGAEAFFSQSLSMRAEDTPSRIYLDRCAYFKKKPPDNNWDGVFQMMTK
jgi:adenylate cyclase